MKVSLHVKHILDLNLAMLFMSTSGVLGRYITMPPAITIWWRCLLAAILLLIYCRWKGISLKVNLSIDGFGFTLASALLAGHWVTYFYALQLSNVAIGMLTLFTYPVFTALLEPLFLKTKFNPAHLILGALVLLGIYILAPELNSSNSQLQGIAFGLFSSLLYSLRNILLKKKIERYHGSTLMFYQLAIATVLLFPALFIFESGGIIQQWPATLTLAIITTAIGHTLFVLSLKNFSVSTASIISGTQPIYGIIIGIIILNEIPQINTIIGGSIILATVIIESLRSYRKNSDN